LTDAEIAENNVMHKEKPSINNGVITDEITYLRQPDKRLLPILARAFHRIYELEIKEDGNSIADVRDIAVKLNIEIIIYGINRKILYSADLQQQQQQQHRRMTMTKAMTNDDIEAAAHRRSSSISCSSGAQEVESTVYLLLDNNHLDPIVKISALAVKEEITRCKFCNSDGECIKNTAKIICCICNKSYFNQDCYAKHITSNRCINYTYKCYKCYKIIRHRERLKELHRCNEYYCGCCKRFAEKSHQCYMQRKSLSPPSEKYIFYDFEKTLNNNNQHIVNYAVAQYFNGKEFIFCTIDKFCTCC
jgi:hypothetical protein